MEKHTQCLLCGSLDIRPLKGYFVTQGLVKCHICTFVFMLNKPTIEELDAYYAQYSYSNELEIPQATLESYNKLLDEFENFRKNNRLLDVGCGRGWFLQEARKRQWDVYGTEYSPKAIELCETNGLTIKEGGLTENMFDAGFFDVITSFEVLEHIYTPHTELQLIHGFLRPGGLFYCTTPNFNSLLRYYLKDSYDIIGYPEHLTYFTRKTLNKLAYKNNFKPYKFLSTGISFTRIKTSQKISQESITSSNSTDEKIRSQIHHRWYLKILKGLANFVLTLTNTGMTLKAYYTKPLK